MRTYLTIGIVASLTLTTIGSFASDAPPAPDEGDIPKPVPAALGLAGAALPDIERFLNVQRASSPSLSPDGSVLTFRTSISGKPQLWAVQTDGGWPRQLTFGESTTFHEFSPDGEWIAYGVDRAGNEREGFYLISPDGLHERELLAPSDAFRVFGGFSWDGARIAYATTERNSRDFDIHILDVATGSDRRVLDGKWGTFVGAWSPDSTTLLISETRGEDANNLYAFDVQTQQLKTLFKPDVAASFSSFAWSPDGQGVFMATDLDADFAGLAYLNMEQQMLQMVETPQHDVGGVSMSRDGRYLTWAVNDGGYTKLHARDLQTGADLGTPALPVGIYRVTWADQAPIAAITVSGPTVPGDIWTWRPGAPARRATHSTTAGLDMDQMVAPTHIDFPARDGVMLHGLLYLPQLDAGVKPPVLLSVHGGPTGQARPRFSAPHQYLLARGIAVFDLNFRGSTGYGKTFARLDNRRLRPNAVRDMEDAMAFLALDGRLDASRAAVMGGSYGGYLAFAAVTTFPDLFDASVSFVGVSNWVTALEGAAPALKASDREEYGDITNPDDREFFRQLSPITNVDRVRTPLMVIHGANDPRDPVTESDQFVKAIRANGGEVAYLRFPDEGHGIRNLSNQIIAYRRIADFLERNLRLR